MIDDKIQILLEASKEEEGSYNDRLVAEVLKELLERVELLEEHNLNTHTISATDW